MIFFQKIKIILLIVFIGSSVWIFKTAPIAINVSGSMPWGLYYRQSNTHIYRGDTVAVCLPTLIARIGLEDRYLLRGRCSQTHTMPILKTVIAVPGDKVDVSSHFITVNGYRYFAPQQQMDSFGHTTKQFIDNGFYVTRGYWLYGHSNPIFSWDSRYFGSVPQGNILGIYRKIRIFPHLIFLKKLPIYLPVTIGSLIVSF